MERGKRQRGEKTKEIMGFLDVCKKDLDVFGNNT